MTNMNPKISIILPVYNVQEGIERAADSLEKQTFSDFEAGFVDDGSKDNSGKICDALSKKDPRFKVIHKKNGGAASARNAAIPCAKGKYLYFMDPDDGCEKNMLEEMYNTAEKFNLELVITGFYIDTYYNKEKFYREKHTAPNKIFNSQYEFRNYARILFDEQLLYAPGNKLFNSEYIKNNNILFPDTFGDDLPFNLEVLKNIKKVGCLNGHYYHFLRARAEAENTKYRPDIYDKREEENQGMIDLYNYGNICDDKTQEFLSRRYTERLIACIENISCKGCKLSNKEKKKAIKDMLNKNHAIEAINKTKPNTLIMRCAILPLKGKSPSLTLLEGKFISYLMHKHVNIFARLLANR